MTKKVAVLIDGGHLRICARSGAKKYDPNFIEKIAHASLSQGEELFRSLYYDCPEYEGEIKWPISGRVQKYTRNDKWISDLSKKDFFAVRMGQLQFRGFVLKDIEATILKNDEAGLAEADFKPKFEQKGVDMRIGLDMAIFSSSQCVDRIALITNDTDCIPAMKHARRSGVQVALIVVPDYSPAPELLAHSDITRKINWPT